jgi:hypothetical protein
MKCAALGFPSIWIKKILFKLGWTGMGWTWSKSQIYNNLAHSIPNHTGCLSSFADLRWAIIQFVRNSWIWRSMVLGPLDKRARKSRCKACARRRIKVRELVTWCPLTCWVLLFTVWGRSSLSVLQEEEVHMHAPIYRRPAKPSLRNARSDCAGNSCL